MCALASFLLGLPFCVGQGVYQDGKLLPCCSALLCGRQFEVAREVKDYY